MKVALISMPWPLFNRPSVQLGVLKGYLRKNLPEIPVQAFHPYLFLAQTLGYQDYLKICDSSWLSESLGAGILFPEMRPKARQLYERLARKEGLAREYEEILTLTENTLSKYLKSIPWKEFQVVGFSVCLNQLTLSLWAAAFLKRCHPHLVVVFGGALCAEDLGRSLLEAFPFIDFVINREGEKPLASLIRALAENQSVKGLPGVFFRENGRIKGGGGAELSPEEIPSPIYEDYFRELSHLLPAKRFFPVIPLEASRGCWWGKCHFCNLNLQWQGYRRRPLERVLQDIRRHAEAGLLDFAFMDNCLDRKEALSLFETLSGDGRDYRIFAELRAIYTAKELRLMRRGGLYWVQIGIEALSTSLLKRLGKGTTATANVAAMRHCEEAGLELSANLICHFPGTTEAEIEETLSALDYVFPFRPLTTVSFWLGYESPVFRHPETFGLRRLYPHPYYRYLFPESLRRLLKPLAWAYQGDRRRQQRLWRPVIEKVKRWHKLWSTLREKYGPLLTYREGGHFLLLRQVTPEGQILHHRLKGPAREVYLFLTEPKEFREIKEAFPGLSAERLWTFLTDLHRKRLLFREGERFLALAIRPDQG